MPVVPFSATEIPAPDAIVRVIEECGIKFVFGIPGGNAMHLFGALSSRREAIRTVSVRHESLAGVMAEVYGKLTGLPGVVMGQGIFMLSNALLGVLEAHMGSTPMLIMTDLSDGAPFSHHAPYQAGTGDHGTWDAQKSFAAVTKETLVAHEAAQAVQLTQAAVTMAARGEGGPIALLYHSGALNGTVGPESVPRLYATPAYAKPALPCADAGLVEKAAGLLAEARQPVIIAGNGVRIAQAYAPLERLASLTGAGVTTTAGGKGVFPEDHALALGVFGTFGLKAANEYLAGSDVILVVGSKLSPSDTAAENSDLIDPARQRIIQIDIEPRNAGWVYPCNQLLTGDAAQILDQMCTIAEKRGAPGPDTTAARQAAVTAVRQKCGYFDGPKFASDAQPMLPQRVIAELGKSIADDAMVTCDAGENRLFMTHYFQTKCAGGFLSPAATGGMGYAIPAALAAKLIDPGRQVIAVCGDGGFAMSMNGMLTAREENIPIVTLVLNNSAFGWVTHFLGERSIVAEFPDMNIAEMARAMGCRGIRVETPDQLAEALATALDGSAPTVLDVICSQEITYRDVLSPLAGG